MNRYVKTAAMVLFVLIGGNLFSQNKIISLWEGKVPGGIPNSTYKETVDSTVWIKWLFTRD